MILALRALGIGDLCTGVPALRALRTTAGEGEELVLAAPAWLAPVVRLSGTVDRLLPVADLAARRLPGPPPRLAVNLHGRGPESHQLLRSVEPPAMWAFDCPAAGFADGARWIRNEHEVQRWCRMLRWYGVATDPYDLEFPQAALPPIGPLPDGATVIHPGAKDPQRRWPAHRFAQVAAALTRLGHRVVVTGSAGETALATSVAGPADLPAEHRLAGQLDAGQLATLVARARLVVCGDTGIGHLTTAYRTPSVLLFGPTPPRWWGPPADRHEHHVLWHGISHGVAAITVAEVLAAADRVLTATGTHQPTSGECGP